MRDLVIRSAVPNDVTAIAVMIEEIERYYGTMGIQPLNERKAQIEMALFDTQPLATAILAQTRGDLIGLATYSFLWPAAGSTHSLYLKELYVRPDCRRSGTGTRLMAELQAIAAARPACSRIEWTTDHDNPTARAFYRALGFEEFTGKVMYRLNRTTFADENLEPAGTSGEVG